MRTKQSKSRAKTNPKNDDRLAGMAEFEQIQADKAKAGHCMFC